MKKNNKNTGNLYGLEFENVGLSQAVTLTLAQIEGKHTALVVTPNVDHFLRFQRNANFRHLYSEASLCFLDGMPLVWLAKLLGYKNAVRVTGVDLTFQVCKALEKSNVPFSIVGGDQESNKQAIKNLQRLYPHLTMGWFSSPTNLELESGNSLDDIAQNLKQLRPGVIAACLGSPKQELFFYEMRSRGVQGVFLGVGAFVDFASGSKRRAPALMQKAGLEWAFRLSLEPKRLVKRYAFNFSFVWYLLRALTQLGK